MSQLSQTLVEDTVVPRRDGAVGDLRTTLAMLWAAHVSQRREMISLERTVRQLKRGDRRPRRRSGPVALNTRGTKSGVPREQSTTALPLEPLPSDAALPDLQIRCFGQFEVVRDGTTVRYWRRSKAKTLLKYLVVRRQPIPRDILLDLLWPDTDPQLSINSLRVTIHALRQALGARCAVPGSDCIVIEDGNYFLNPRAHIWVDVDEFATQFELARRMEREGRIAEALRSYEQAEALYRDDFLVEDLYEEWTLVRREELKDQYLMVLTRLAHHCFQQHDNVGCILRCHKILEKDACREDAYQRLMQCYAQLGQRSQAVHWYGICVRTLRHELDVSPTDQTRRLYEQLITGQSMTVAR